MSELTINDYQAKVAEYAWFTDEPDAEKRRDIVYYGFTEEKSELLYDEDHPKELTSMLWGLPISGSVASEVADKAVSEMGDVLYYLTAAGMLQEVSLATMVQRGIKIFTGQTAIKCESLTDFDTLLVDKMEPPKASTYMPDYFAMQFWGLSPLYYADRDDCITSLTESITGPIHVSGDGRFLLERTLRGVSEWIAKEPTRTTETYFTEHAAIALGSLSAVAQNRFGSSLAAIADRNISKLERRRQNKTQQDGADEERSRKPGEARPHYSGWDTTVGDLIFSPKPVL